MPVTTTHPQYEEALSGWRKTADLLAGSDALKRSAEVYFPRLQGHMENDASYVRYIEGLVLFNGTERTISALAGSIFRKDPTVVVPARLKPRMDNINGAGESFYTFSKRMVRDVLAFGRYGLLVEAMAPSEDGNSPSLDVRDQAANLPWLAAYDPRDIRCWRTRIVAGAPILDQVILHECKQVAGDDEFGFKMVSIYRVLDLDDQGYYRVRLYQEVGKDEYEQVAEFLPKPRGQRINYIPFVFIGPTDLRPDITRSPILDLVEVNLSHARSTIDLEAGRSKLAYPMPVIVSDAEQVELKFGGDWALWLPLGSDAKFLEFNGKGMEELAAALPQKEGYMAALGARLLQEPQRQAEAAETHYIKQSSENSTLASVAKTCGDGLKQALTYMAEWVSASGEVKCELNTDFFDVPISPQAITSLVAAVQAGLMPVDDFLWVLKQGELLRHDLTIEEARSLIEQDTPRLMGTPENLNDPNAPPPANDPQQPKSGATAMIGSAGGLAPLSSRCRHGSRRGRWRWRLPASGWRTG